MVLLNPRNDLSYLHHLLIIRLLMNDVFSVRGYHIVTMSLIYNVSCFQFASYAAASISQTVSCYPLALTPLPHAPSATLMMHCTLDNVKCIFGHNAYYAYYRGIVRQLDK